MNSDLFLIVSEADPIESRQALLVYNDSETAERHLSLMNQYDPEGPFLIVDVRTREND